MRLRLLQLLLYLYLKTMRWKLIMRPEATFDLLSQGVIYAIWHDSLLSIPLLFPLFRTSGPLSILISKSRDGDLPSSLVKSFPNIDVIRVGHTARAAALKAAVDCLLKRRSILITPDGPKGPARSIKHGVHTASRLSGKPIVPIAIKYAWALRLPTWDRFHLPIPFSAIEIELGAPLFHHNSTEERLKAALNGICQ